MTLSFRTLRGRLLKRNLQFHAAYSKDFCNNRMRHYDLSRLCSLEEIRSYVGTGAYQECVIDVKRICLESFPDQAVPDGNSSSNSPAFTVTEETFSVLELKYKREAEIFFSEPPSQKSIFDDKVRRFVFAFRPFYASPTIRNQRQRRRSPAIWLFQKIGGEEAEVGRADFEVGSGSARSCGRSPNRVGF